MTSTYLASRHVWRHYQYDVISLYVNMSELKKKSSVTILMPGFSDVYTYSHVWRHHMRIDVSMMTCTHIHMYDVITCVLTSLWWRVHIFTCMTSSHVYWSLSDDVYTYSHVWRHHMRIDVSLMTCTHIHMYDVITCVLTSLWWRVHIFTCMTS